MSVSSRSGLPGALVLSLDFELLWGVRDRGDAVASYGPSLRGAREIVPLLLQLFHEFDVAATWAIVGFLFADSREELERFSPTRKPKYLDPRLSPYGDAIGESEADDPFRLAPSLIEQIGRTPRQEIATHTFSHYYCGEQGQTPDDFRADLAAAQALARLRGHELQSIIFPRNQFDASYLGILPEFGIRSYRGNPAGGSWAFTDGSGSRRSWKRLARLSDRYIGSSHGTVSWDSVHQRSGLTDVRASCFLAPYRPTLRSLEELRLRRLVGRIRAAAREGSLVHLWWHPHNFGLHMAENLSFLRAALSAFADLQERYGMLSLSMAEVDEAVRGRLDTPPPPPGRGRDG